MSELQKFIFEGLPVRGAIVQLTDVWQETLARHRQSHPQDGQSSGLFLPAVCELVGEMSAAAVLLSTTIKFDGTLILQIQGDGPLKLAVAEVQPGLGVRATAKTSGTIPPLGGIDALCNVHGQGKCAITLDPQNRKPGQQPYQGVVPLNDAQGRSFVHLSQVIEGYMQQSEQLPTHIILAADEHRAAGLLIQHLPGAGENNIGAGAELDADGGSANEHFNRLAILAQSLQREELLTLSVHDILHRLFWQEKVRLFGGETPRFQCTCSRERVANMLRGLGQDEVKSIVSEQGAVEVNCDFCGAVYHFDAVDADKLFVPDNQQPPVSDALQ